jgi:two-component sensor histidine kinase
MDSAWVGVQGGTATLEGILGTCGRAGHEVLGFDWSTTSLGAMETWSQSLVTTVALTLSSRQPMCMWWGHELYNFHNDAYSTMLGKRAPGAIGRPARFLWDDVWDDILPLIRQALSGEAVWREDLPLVMTRNGYDEETWFTFSYSPVRDDTGRVVGMLNTVTETTQSVLDRQALVKANADLAVEVERTREALEHRIETDKRNRVLQRELTHRMKNTLAMVQAVVSQSIRHSASLDDAMRVVSERIGALSKAQDILTKNSWETTDIREVVSAAIMPHVDVADRFRISGPDLYLTAQQSLGLALAIHELGTNAAKYGALSDGAGRVEISWTLAAEGDFLFSWRECDGPEVEPPSRRGFGSRLVERIVGSYFNGRGELSYEAEGVLFTLTGRIE